MEHSMASAHAARLGCPVGTPSAHRARCGVHLFVLDLVWGFWTRPRASKDATQQWPPPSLVNMVHCVHMVVHWPCKWKPKALSHRLSHNNLEPTHCRGPLHSGTSTWDGHMAMIIPSLRILAFGRRRRRCPSYWTLLECRNPTTSTVTLPRAVQNTAVVNQNCG